MTTFLKILLLVAVVFVAVPGCATDALTAPISTFTLAQSGKPDSTIVLAHHPARSAAFAAAELQDHVRDITGATLPIVREPAADQTAAITGARILVGESAATRKLGLKGDDFKPQEYLIRIAPKTLILLGKDTTVYDTPDTTLWTHILWPTKTDGKFGTAAKFDGKNTYIGIPYNNNFTDARGTLEGWVRLDAADNEKPGTILRWDGGNPWSYQIVQQDPHSQVISYTTFVSGKGPHVLKSKPLKPGWHFFMATHDAGSGKMALYMDGKPLDTATYNQTGCQGATLNVGGLIRSPKKVLNPFTGSLQDLRISNIVRAPYVPTAPLKKDANTSLLVNLANGEWDNGQATMGKPLPDLFSDHGTLSATYAFLRRYCGVRWYMPGTLGLVTPHESTLKVTGSEVRRAPAMKYRFMGWTHFYLRKGDQEIPERDMAMWKLRMNLGGEQYSATHSFYSYYGRFMKEHPDWFASTDTAVGPQLRFSNPQVVGQVVQDARNYFDGKGLAPGVASGAGNSGAVAAGKYFSLVPMDTYTWAPEDRARFDKSQLSNKRFSNGLTSPVVWGFTNDVARQLAKTNPGDYISQLAYAQYAYYPKNLALEPNISVQMCLEVRNWWQPSVEANDRKILQQWTSAEAGKRPLFLWLYYCFPALMGRNLNYNVFPGFFGHQVVQQMKLYRDSGGIDGLSLEDSQEGGLSFLNDIVELQVTFRLADDPSLDGDQLIHEFFTKYYGAAGSSMEQLYNEIEATFTNPKNYPERVQTAEEQLHQNEELAWKYLGTPERMAKWQVLMTQAKAAAKTPLEKQRVQLFETTIWDSMKAGAAHYRKVGPTQEKLRAQGPPKLKVPRIADSNGDLSHVNWDQATKSQPWHTTMGGPSERDLEMQLAHDDKYFYVRLEEKGDTSKLVNTSDIYHGDHWEMFFAAARKAPYRQLSFNLQGKTSALDLKGIGQTEDWESGAKVLSQVTDGLILAQVAIPLDQLSVSGVRVGTPFYANFFRAKSNGDALSWSATFSTSFHDLAHLGELTLQ